MFKIILFSLFVPFFAFADQALKDQMKSDLDVVRTVLESSYAPRAWKQTHFGWDLDTEIAKAKDKVQQLSAPSVKEYQFVLRDFFNSLNDYHVNVWFYSTEKATLPFQVKEADGRYFITYIDEEQASSLPMEVGDELVSFDGKAVATVIQDLKKYHRTANEATDNAFAALHLTQRVGEVGHVVPKGPVSIAIKKQGAKATSFQLIWDYTPERIMHSVDSILSGNEEFKVTKSPLLNLKFMNPVFEKKSKVVGYKKSRIPALGRIWWQAEEESPFDAYIFETEDRRLIGFIRIPDFIGAEEDTEAFAKIIAVFEERTEALVIDQNDNPGGFIFYCYALASLLTDYPLRTPLQRMTITQEDVYAAVASMPKLEKVANDEEARELLGESLFGLPVSFQTTRFILNFNQFVIDEWNAGRRLTNPTFLLALDQINPHPDTHYSKPILLLINQFDFSCADFFPAILQDNKRATLLGSRTAGAGGYVRAVGLPNRFGVVAFSYTGSIAERVDKNPIENLGVTPDVAYTITENDLQNNYEDYVKKIKEVLKDESFFLKADLD